VASKKVSLVCAELAASHSAVFLVRQRRFTLASLAQLLARQTRPWCFVSLQTMARQQLSITD